MKKRMISMKAIRALDPYTDLDRYLPKDFNETIQTFLCIEEIPAKDRLRIIVRTNYLTERELREFGLACARLVEHLSNDGLKLCNDTTEAYLDDKATADQICTARDAAYAAAYATEPSVFAPLCAAIYAAHAVAYEAAREAMHEEQCQMLLHILEMEGTARSS